MIIVFASSIFANDPQVNLLVKKLEDSGKEFLLINPLDFSDMKKLELVSFCGENRLIFEGEEIIPTCFYLSRKLRTDCIISFPRDCITPNLYRSKTNAFLLDIAHSFKDLRWIPGTVDKIDLSESKCALFSTASSCGLKVPEMTINSFIRPTQPTYRKSLSDPFIITYDLEDKEEIAITLFNSNSPEEGDFGIPWQWQTEIKLVNQLRCIFVGNNNWVFSTSNTELAGLSLREAQENNEVHWEQYSLPEEISLLVRRLMKKLDVKIACPEFIINPDGDYYFIDLNPCGDWFGFGPESVNLEIASAIVEIL